MVHMKVFGIAMLLKAYMWSRDCVLLVCPSLAKDEIFKVNGHSGAAIDLVKLLKSGTWLEVVVQRRALHQQPCKFSLNRPPKGDTSD